MLSFANGEVKSMWIETTGSKKMASDDDAGLFPPNSLEDSVWERLLDQAFSMDETDIPASIVPEVEEFELTNDTTELFMFDDTDDINEFDTDTMMDFPELDLPLDFE